MLNKSIRRNVIPATACASGSTTTSKQEQERYASGIRFYITVAGGSTTGGIDAFFLCAVPPGGAAAIPLVGFSGASALSVNGTYMADFYPGAWLPPLLAAGGALLGAAGINIPEKWAVRVVMGTGSAATITVDAEVLPS